jgi:hypothetical protein
MSYPDCETYVVVQNCACLGWTKSCKATLFSLNRGIDRNKGSQAVEALESFSCVKGLEQSLEGRKAIWSVKNKRSVKRLY